MKISALAIPFLLAVAIACDNADEEITIDGLPYSPDYITATNLSGDVVPGIMRIKLKQAPESIDEIKEIVSGVTVKKVERTFPVDPRFEERTRAAGLDRWYDIFFEEETSLTRAAASVLADKRIQEVEGIHFVKHSSVDWPFNDPDIHRQWHYCNDGSLRNSIEGADINLLEAWKIETGNENVVVAVLDDGVRIEHEDLKESMWQNSLEINGLPGVDDDGNGYIDDKYGYNFCNDTGNIQTSDHGTHVSGTIAAVNNNGKGGAGVAGGDGLRKGARILFCQMMMEGNMIGNTPAAFKYAADNGAVIANNSWGYIDQSIGGIESSVKDAIDYFRAYAGIDADGNQIGPMAGGIVFFSAGNESTSSGGWPGRYEGAFSVCAISSNWEIADYSNYGSWVDIAAPGGSISLGPQIYSLTGASNSSYDFYQGTSMACPHVSGVAALIVSHYGGQGFTPDDLWNIMKNSANSEDLYKYNPGKKGMLGVGMVNAGAALSNEGPLAPSIIQGVQANSIANSVNVSWLVASDPESGKAALNAIFISEGSLKDFSVSKEGEVSDDNVTKIVIPTGIYKVGDTISHVIEGLKFRTDYYIRICALDNLHNHGPLSEEVKVTTGTNSAPVITALDGTSISIKEYERALLRFAVNDPDGHELSARLDRDVNGISLGRIKDGECTVSFDGAVIGKGSYSLNLIVSDGFDETSTALECTIRGNEKPVVTNTIDNIVLNGIGSRAEMDLSDYFSDPDGESLNYSVSSSSSSIIFKSDIKGSVLTVEGNWYGSTIMTITAVDALGESVSQESSLLVRDGSKDFDLYPNPVSDKLNIRAGNKASIKVRIVSGIGSVVFESSMDTSPFSPAQVDMSDFVKGVYTVFVKGQDKEEKYVIVKE